MLWTRDAWGKILMLRTKIALIALIALPAFGQENSEMTEKTKSLGIAVGNAYACTAAEGRERMDEEVHLLFDLILKDAGSDLAFAYATSTGYGAHFSPETLDCPAVLENWEKSRVEFGLVEESE